MSDLSIAVVVPTYRRPESLEQCLHAIAAQTVAPERVVVVVRHGDDETAAALARFRSILSFESISVAEAGVVAAMNMGLARCEEDVVAVTDDDARPHPDWLERLREGYGADVGGVGGRDVIESPGQVTRRPDPPVGQISWYGRLQGNHHVGSVAPRDVDVLKGVNMSLLRELWRLDTDLRGEGAQVHWEVGVCLRARRNGWRLVYDPAAQVDHAPARRYDDNDRSYPTLAALSDAEWNYAHVLGRYVGLLRLPGVASYLLGVGTRRAPGLITAIVLCLSAPMRSPQTLRLFGVVTRARVSGLVSLIRPTRQIPLDRFG